MGILFKTYNGKHQLHLYREVWVMKNKAQMEEILALFSKKELSKAKITPAENQIEIELNGLIVDCKDVADLKTKFALLVDLKTKYQKVTPEEIKKPKKSK
ncbi:hypothetical protein HZC32_00660 [Candidatus Woesearchaeota archaeon]|nr:hypothetical protein [Candidatus Woesearchaeota archaeon]